MDTKFDGFYESLREAAVFVDDILYVKKYTKFLYCPLQCVCARAVYDIVLAC